MHPDSPNSRIFLLLCLCLPGAACERGPAEGDRSAMAVDDCAPDNGGLKLPPGFCAVIVADNLGFVRHIAAGGEGRMFVAFRNRRFDIGGLRMISDRNGDGFMEDLVELNNEPGIGVAITGSHLYFGADRRIVRYPLDATGMPVADAMDIVADGFPAQERHSGKAIVVDPAGNLYVNVGAPSDACQEQEGVAGSPGRDPCPQLDDHAGIWRFDARRTGQDFHLDGERFAAGVRNAYALDWHPELDALFAVQHGRDQLHELWPERYGEEDGAELPAEEMLRLEPGAEYGWPYCYYDPRRQQRVLAPEYGGSGAEVGRCDRYPPPVIGFPAHYGPNDMVIYTGSQFPARYRGGAFIAFHGSYNRGPFEQVGYRVDFVPRQGRGMAPEWEVFADGFAGSNDVTRPEQAEHRPTGLAVGGDGSLYVADSVQGRIWRIRYRP